MIILISLGAEKIHTSSKNSWRNQSQIFLLLAPFELSSSDTTFFLSFFFPNVVEIIIFAARPFSRKNCSLNTHQLKKKSHCTTKKSTQKLKKVENNVKKHMATVFPFKIPLKKRHPLMNMCWKMFQFKFIWIEIYSNTFVKMCAHLHFSKCEDLLHAHILKNISYF